MAAGKPDIELLFGVLGGGSIKEGSGKDIADQIGEIVKQINANPLGIKFKADEASLKNIKTQIEKIMGTVKVPVEATISGAAKNSAGAATASSKVLKDDIAALNSAMTRIEKMRATLGTSLSALDSIDSSKAGSQLTGRTDKYLADLTRLEDSLNRLAQDARTADVSQATFRERLSAIALEAQKASNGIKDLSNAAGNLEQQMSKANVITSKSISEMRQVEALSGKLKTSELNLNKLGNLDELTDLRPYRDEVAGLTDRLEELARKLKETGVDEAEFKDELASISLVALQASNKISELTKTASALKKELKDSEIIGGGSSSALKELNQIEDMRHKLAENKMKLGAFDQNDQSVITYNNQIDSLISSLSELHTGINNQEVTRKKFEEEFGRITLEAKKASNGITEYASSIKISADAQKLFEESNKKIEQSLSTIASTRQKYGTLGLSAGHQGEIRALNEYEQKLEELRAKLNDGKMSQNEFNSAIASVNSGIIKASVPLDKFGASIENVGSQVGQFIKYSLGIYSVYTVFSKGTQVIKEMVNNAIELESAFADTRIVTHATNEELKAFGVTITDIANDTAASIESLVSATTAFARLGYSLEESTALAKYTGMLEKVGNVDTQQAEDAITSILKAFPEDADVHNIEQVMDKLVITGNNFPISVAQIAEGMTNASSALAAAGNSFDQSVALLTAANTTVQNASKASTALRTISARIRKTKADLDDLGEVMTESQHEEMVKALTKYHVQLTDVNGAYKSTYEIMQGIAAQWDKMTSMEQAALAELVSGTRQQVVFYSIIENFKEASGAMNAMADSAGALSSSYDIYLGTAAAQVERLGIAWKTFSMDFVNGDTLKAVINIGIALLRLADTLQRAHVLLPTILATVVAFKSLKLAKSLTTMRTAADAFAASLMQQGVVSKGLEANWVSLTATQQAYIVSQLQLMANNGNESAQIALMALEMNGLATAEAGAAIGADALNVSIKGLMASNPIGWIALIVSGVISVISIVSSAIKKNQEAKKSLEDIKQEMSDMTASIQNTANSLRDMNQKASDIIPRFAELAKGVDAFGNNTGKLNDEEYSEFVGLTNQLAELFPELNVGIDANGNAMLNLSYTAGDLADELWRVVEAQQTLARQEIASQMNDAVETAKASDEAYKLEERKIEGAIQSLNTLKQAFRDSKQIGELSMINGDEQLVSLIDSIRAVSPEIDSVVAKLGRTSDATGGILYSLLAGDGSQYAVEDEFYEEIDRIIATTQAKLASAQNDTSANQAVVDSFIKQTTVAWAQGLSNYQGATDAIQSLIISAINNIDTASLNLTTGSALQNYVYSSIIKPLSGMTAEAQRSVSRYLDVSSSFANGSSNVAQMSAALDTLTKSLNKSGLSAEETESVFEALGATGIASKIDTVSKSITGEADAVDKFVSSMDSEELERAYNILTANGGKMMALDELKTKLDAVSKAAEVAGRELKEVMSLENFFTGVKKISKNVNDVVSAMKKLKEGTSLTIEELANLAEQYPELLTQSNLYTDGSIAGQERLLNVILEANQKEYESTVRTKIAELEATLKSVESRSAAELFSSLGWIETQETLARGDMDPNARSAALHAAQQNAKNQIQNEINNISNFGSDFISNALRDMEAALAKSVSSSSSSYSGGGSNSSYTAKNDPIGDWVRQNKYKIEIGAQDALSNMADYLVQFAQVIHDNMFNWIVSEDDAKQYIEDLVKGIKQLETDAKNAIDSLVSYRLKTLQDEQKQEEKNAKDRIDALKDFYDEQKKLLKEQAEEDEYREEQAEKRKSVSDLQIAIDQIKYDDSSFAQKRSVELQEQLDKAQKELDKFEKDKALEDAENMLDRQYKEQSAKIEAESNARIAEIQNKINDIDKQLNDPKAFYNQMLDDIKNNSQMIYEQLTEYGGKNSDGVVDADATKVFNEAVRAVEVLNKYLEMNNGKLYNYNGYYVPGSIGANQIVWVFEDDKLVPVISNRGGYASGTMNSTSGLHKIDENGSEMIFTSSNGSKYRVFSHGEKVLDAEATNFLYKFANSKGREILTAARAISSREYINESSAKTTNFKTGDIIINGGVDGRTVSEIRRAQREQMRELLVAFGRMK